MKIPTRIHPSPLTEAAVDVRYQPAIPNAAVFGYVYSLIKDRYGPPSPLPILQLPEEIREKDGNLAFQPHYRMEKPPFSLQLGPRIFNIAVLDQGYPGWEKFKEEICRIFDELSRNRVIERVNRVGMRYINFFEVNVFQISNFSISVGTEPLIDEKAYLRVQFSGSGFITAVQVTNDGTLLRSGQSRQGSVIDVDTFCLQPDLREEPFKKFSDLIESAHTVLKQRFFSGLKEDFVATLNPQYS